MALNFLKKLFGFSQQPSADSGPASSSSPKRPSPSGPESEPDLESFVAFIVRALVDDPDQVHVETIKKDRDATIQVKCDKNDVGKVIGRNGKTIAAIRALANGAGARAGQRVGVEILD